MDKYSKIFSRQECPPRHVFMEYIQGTLPSKESHLFEKHLIDCPMCEEVLEGMQTTESQDFTEDLAQLHQRIDKKKNNYTVWYAVAASVSLLLVSTFLLVNFLKDQRQEVSIDYQKEPSSSSPAPVLEQKPEQKKADRVADSQGSPAPPIPASPKREEPPLASATSIAPVPPREAEADAKEEEVTFALAEEQANDMASPSPGAMQMDTIQSQLEEVVVNTYAKSKKSDLRRSTVSSKEEKKLKLDTKGPLAPQYPNIQLLILSGQLDSAGKEIDILLLKNPLDEDALWLKADVLIRRDSKKEAKKILKQLVDSQGTYARAAKKRMKEL